MVTIFPKNTLNKELINGIFLLSAICLFAYFQPTYLLLNFSLFLGVLFAPFIFRKINDQASHRFFIPAVGIGILLFFIPTNSLYYFFWVVILLYLLETWKGQYNNLPVFLFLVVSYISQQILNNWSFPIRLQLSAWAGQVIGLLGYETAVVGNVIHLDGIPFSVDPACMGLKMMVTAQLLALVILAYYEHKNKWTFSVPRIGGYLVFGMLLTVLANFIRILALVIFYILPENPLHDVMGLLSLVVYVLLPLYWIIGYFNNKKNTSINDDLLLNTVATSKIKFSWTSLLLAKCLLLSLLLLHGIRSQRPIQAINVPYPTRAFQNFTSTQTANGILKLENEAALIYIKPPVQFFQGSHDPRVCWSGSGYDFTNIKVETIGGTAIYTALLQHKEEELYTAWWYDNLTHQTIEEWQWRWERLRGEKGYYLVNVSSEDRATLMAQVASLLTTK